MPLILVIPDDSGDSGDAGDSGDVSDAGDSVDFGDAGDSGESGDAGKPRYLKKPIRQFTKTSPPILKTSPPRHRTRATATFCNFGTQRGSAGLSGAQRNSDPRNPICYRLLFRSY